MTTEVIESETSKNVRGRRLSTKEDNSEALRTNNEVDVCSICFEEWTTSGQHRLVSTPCGHLFGKKCIEYWLRTTPHCPQCQSFTRRRDLHRIYCRAIQALDTSERDNAIRERDLERNARRILEYEKGELQVVHNTLKEQFKRLQTENDRLLKLTHHLNEVRKTAIDSSQSLILLPSINMQLETIIKIPEGMCRVLAYVPAHQWLFVSQATDNNIHPNYGIKKINLLNPTRTCEYVTLHHTKPIRDIQIHGNQLLSCAWDKTLRVFDYIHNTSDLLCQCTSQVWSCSWNLDDPNIIYAGLNNGRIEIFDRRQVQINEHILSSNFDTLNLFTSSPILSLQYIEQNSHFPASGLLVGSQEKSGFFQYTSNNCEHHLHELPINKNLSSLHYDPISNRLIASFRPSSNPVRHELYELNTSPHQSLHISLQLIQTFIGSSVNIILSRSKILHKNREIYILASDNGSHGIEIWNIRQATTTPSFKLSIQCDMVDVCLTHQYVCILADNQVRLYKWT